MDELSSLSYLMHKEGNSLVSRLAWFSTLKRAIAQACPKVNIALGLLDFFQTMTAQLGWFTAGVTAVKTLRTC